MQTANIFSNYSTSPILGHQAIDFGLLVSRTSIIPSLVHHMGVHLFTPPPPFMFMPSTEASIIDVASE